MKRKARLSMILAALVLACVSLSAQKPADLVGTWVGPGTLEGETDVNELTLVLWLEEGVLAGHLTGEYGTLNESPISDISLKDGVFSFSVMVESSEASILCKFTMNVDEDTMEGKIEIPDWGVGGTWEATKQK